jgi:hypothetical protein
MHGAYRHAITGPGAGKRSYLHTVISSAAQWVFRATSVLAPCRDGASKGPERTGTAARARNRPPVRRAAKAIMESFPDGLSCQCAPYHAACMQRAPSDSPLTTPPGQPLRTANPMTKKVYVKTFGCQMNEYDSDKMVDVLNAAEGLEKTDTPEDADIILFNTCSVREKAQEKVFSDLGRVRS